MAAVGEDIESICGKCGDVWHVVVAKVGTRVAKVQCKQCQGYHRHSTGKKSSTRASKASKAVVESLPEGPLLEADMSRPVKTYSPRETYLPADRVAHPKFGEGIVETDLGPGKVQVCFPDKRRVLAAAKPTSTLQRPKMRAITQSDAE